MEAEPSSVLLRNSVVWPGGHFDSLRASSQFCDMTLLCEDGTSFPAHKVIISSQSQKLRTILAQFPASPFCLYLTGVAGHHLASLLAFIYSGEVRLSQADLPSFLAAAETLQVSGLQEDQQEARGEITEQEDVLEVKEEFKEKSLSLVEAVRTVPAGETKQSSDDDSSIAETKYRRSYYRSRKIIKLHTSEQAREERDRQWDDVETVSYEFIKTGKSKPPGMLTTHDRSYKV